MLNNYTNLELPDVMINSNDFLFFENLNTKPNFVGNTLSKGDIILGSENNMNQLKNKIILLQTQIQVGIGFLVFQLKVL